MSGKMNVLQDGNPIVPDYKVALNENSEKQYLWDLISDVNKVEGNETNIWVKLGDDNKIKMYRKTEQYTPNEFKLNIDSFTVTEANSEKTLPAYRPDAINTFIYFPISLPTGRIAAISILGWGGASLTTGFIAVYGSDKPTINDAKLLFKIENEQFINNTIEIPESVPPISAKNEDGTENAFMFCVFCCCGENDGGYRILSKCNKNLNLIAEINPDNAINCIGTFESVLTGFHFNETFDYRTVNDGNSLSNFRMPYINFSSIVES